MDPRTRAAVAWLLGSGEPAIRLMTRRDLLGERADDDAGQVLAGAKVTALLSGQQPDGGFGVHPYRKWTGAHWRLVSLAELAIPPREPRAVAAAGHVLAWLASPARRVPRIGGLARAHASIEGNALAACCRLGWPPTRGSGASPRLSSAGNGQTAGGTATSPPPAFRPERFLDEGAESYSWIPFGGGIRRCIGAALAQAEMAEVLRVVLQRSELALERSAPEPVVLRTITLTPKHGVPVRVLRTSAPARSSTAGQERMAARRHVQPC